MEPMQPIPQRQIDNSPSDRQDAARDPAVDSQATETGATRRSPVIADGGNADPAVQSPEESRADLQRRRPRLRQLRGRLSAGSSPSRNASDSEGAGSAGPWPRRPRLRHRFSRSLTNLITSRTEQDDDANDAEGGQLSRWRARSKAKLVRAFTPSLEDGAFSGGASSSTASPAPAPFGFDAPLPDRVAELGRVASRGRSHSAPLLLVRSTEIASPSSVPHQLSVLAAVAPSDAEDPPSEVQESPQQSPFHTCPSSPSFDADPKLVAQAPVSSLGDAQAALQALTAPNPDLFARLPYEIQLRVFQSLLDVCEADWHAAIRSGRWTGNVARARWSDGRARGRRELIKAGRVCKLWRTLSLDGQLWPTVPGTSILGPDTFSTDGINSLVDRVGTLATAFDAKGLGARLDWKSLSLIVDTARAYTLSGVTRFTSIDLTGCTALTPSSLSSLLSHSPALETLKVPGVRCVNEGHMRVLGSECPRLRNLDVTRCACLPAAALLHLPYPPPRPEMSSLSASSASPNGLGLLRAAGLSGMNDFVVTTILDRHPWLHTLDVSFSRLHDEAFKALVQKSASSAPSSAAGGPSQAGRHPVTAIASSNKRVFTSLKHLSLTGCSAITSIGLGHLADTLPNLEIFEIARLGVRARTDGIARLLASCPKLRKVDLEYDCELGDDVLLALLPVGKTGAPNLEHLNVSGCIAMSDQALARVAASCSKLRALEADGTAISDRTARTFIDAVAQRAATARDQAAAKQLERGGAIDSLLASKYPALLSVLDDRTTGRRLSREAAAKRLRPRHGQRGYWTHLINEYHDDDGDDDDETVASSVRDRKPPLAECDPERIVVRSFHASLAVDAANAAAQIRANLAIKAAGGDTKVVTSRLRSLSDSEVFRRSPSTPFDERIGCIVS